MARVQDGAKEYAAMLRDMADRIETGKGCLREVQQGFIMYPQLLGDTCSYLIDCSHDINLRMEFEGKLPYELLNQGWVIEPQSPEASVIPTD